MAGDYFINFDFVSLSALRAIFGVWINICVAIIAICIRFVFHYRIKRILSSGRRRVNLWRVSPALTTSEVIELRHVLIRALIHGNYFFVLASLFCVIVALVGAASTIISNYSVVANPAIRDSIVQGQNVTHFFNHLGGATLEVSTRVKALDRANAPLDELFDFVPDDNLHWVYRASQWNNTWKGTCTFSKHETVELDIYYPTNTSTYQSQVPLLGKYIPRWATEDPSKQGGVSVGIWDWIHNGSESVNVNDTKWWTNVVVTYVFGSSLDYDAAYAYTYLAKTSNISIVNYLIPRMEVLLVTDSSIKTTIRSDIHVAECGFVNTLEKGSIYQANAAGGTYNDAAQGIAGMYLREVVMNTTANRPVIQPTGMQMLRYWQAYMSVKDSQFPNPAVRSLAVVQDVVQMRLSSLVVTVGAFFLAVVAACVAKYRGVKNKAHRIQLPSSQLDWIVQSAREHAKPKPETGKPRSRTKSLDEFVIHNQDNFFIIAPNFDPRIVTNSEPGLSILEPLSSSLQSSYEDEDFDPWVGYEETHPFPTSRS